MKRISIIIGTIALAMAITLPVLAANYTATVTLTNTSVNTYQNTPIMVHLIIRTYQQITIS